MRILVSPHFPHVPDSFHIFFLDVQKSIYTGDGVCQFADRVRNDFANKGFAGFLFNECWKFHVHAFCFRAVACRARSLATSCGAFASSILPVLYLMMALPYHTDGLMLHRMAIHSS